MVKLGEEEVPSDELVVLVVDDDVDAATALCCLLELLGCKTAVAFDGPSAVKVGTVTRPQAAFIDLDLPGFDGCEVLRRLKSGGSAGPGRSVCLTGHGGPLDRARCFDAGFDEFWSKPVAVTEVERALAASREAVRGDLVHQDGGLHGHAWLH
ncbi:response regulator [Aquabacterium sp. A7-Y]|uniref:response regulator transcription factor n=1 Tax=Aquabacterium sp. A7-Y TaxID=1349605 RepID=UPI00223E6D54|nr:response regulator [Aquabacterium sp. A7-Y]MCW7536755.1 response regulator [Aquabacterium sp. A7-Y]